LATLDPVSNTSKALALTRLAGDPVMGLTGLPNGDFLMDMGYGVFKWLKRSEGFDGSDIQVGGSLQSVFLRETFGMNVAALYYEEGCYILNVETNQTTPVLSGEVGGRDFTCNIENGFCYLLAVINRTLTITLFDYTLNDNQTAFESFEQKSRFTLNENVVSIVAVGNQIFGSGCDEAKCWTCSIDLNGTVTKHYIDQPLKNSELTFGPIIRQSASTDVFALVYDYTDLLIFNSTFQITNHYPNVIEQNDMGGQFAFYNQ
jgi:hypothetical protein